MCAPIGERSPSGGRSCGAVMMRIPDTANSGRWIVGSSKTEGICFENHGGGGVEPGTGSPGQDHALHMYAKPVPVTST